MYVFQFTAKSDQVFKAYKEWKKLDIAKEPSDDRYEKIRRYVLEVPDLDESMRKDLAILLLGDEFCLGHESKMPIPLTPSTIDFYLDLFREKGLDLDKEKLTLHLISLDITHAKITREPSDYKIDFGELSTQIDYYYNEHMRTIQSYYGHINRARRYFRKETAETPLFKSGGARISEDYKILDTIGKGGQKIAYKVL
ncbi:MAG: hypothetical protein Q4G69_13905 [Planctomycetia bacterium]|nr:hypothetical protein [Planctomycetia bacterium]